MKSTHCKFAKFKEPITTYMFDTDAFRNAHNLKANKNKVIKTKKFSLCQDKSINSIYLASLSGMSNIIFLYLLTHFDRKVHTSHALRPNISVKNLKSTFIISLAHSSPKKTHTSPNAWHAAVDCSFNGSRACTACCLRIARRLAIGLSV